MFTGLIAAPVTYRAPWDYETLESRVSELIGGKGRRIAYLYGQPDTSTFRYRVYNMVEAIRARPAAQLTASWFQLAEIERLITLLPQIDVLVLARIRYDRNVAHLMVRAAQLNVRVLFDCDDLVFDTQYTHLIAATLDQDTFSEECWDYWFAYISRHQRVLEMCSGGITTNRYLAERMGRIVNGPVKIVQNFMNRRQQELSEELLKEKAARKFVAEAPICIGYFSGSPSHNLDLQVAMPALLSVLRERKDVHLRIVGFMDSFSSLEPFRDRVERVSLQDWLNLQVKIAEVDLNIAPLQRNVFTNGKSELKFFEAAAVGTWTCAAPTDPFVDAIGDSGLAQLSNDQSWYDAINVALGILSDHCSYAEVATKAAKHVNKIYGWDRQYGAIEAALAA